MPSKHGEIFPEAWLSSESSVTMHLQVYAGYGGELGDPDMVAEHPGLGGLGRKRTPTGKEHQSILTIIFILATYEHGCYCSR
jgi:hypothetical protein